MKSLIEHELKALASPTQRVVLMRFFKTGKGQYGEGDKFLGVKVPQTRAVMKKYAAACSLSEIKKLIASPYHEQLNLSRQYGLYHFIERRTRERAHLRILKNFASGRLTRR